MVFWLDVPQASLNNYITQWSQHIFHRKVCVFRVALWKAPWGRPRYEFNFPGISPCSDDGHPYGPVAPSLVTSDRWWHRLSPFHRAGISFHRDGWAQVESLLNAGVRVLLYQGQFDWRLVSRDSIHLERLQSTYFILYEDFYGQHLGHFATC